MSSLRTKRRRAQISVQHLINEVYDNSQNHLSNVNIDTEVETLIGTSLCMSDTSLNYSSDSEISCDSDSDAVSSPNLDKAASFNEKFTELILKHNITNVATDDFLKLFNDTCPQFNLPLCSKTVLSTPTNYKILKIDGGEYFHFGIVRKLINSLALSNSYTFEYNKENFLSLKLGIDGLPVSMSSKKQFWPILCIIEEAIDTSPFLVGLFYGESKPKQITEFLDPLVKELFVIKNRIFLIGSYQFRINISLICADAPARSFLKQISAHNGYSGCERCITKGIYKHNKIIFPELNQQLRTGQSFRERSDKSHHNGPSPLEQLDINLVSQFPLDYMHLCCLGVMKKLLLTWCLGPIPYKESRATVQLLSQKIVKCKNFVPAEFHRKPRSLDDLKHWKATEFRQFILYLGPFVLKGILPTPKYNHFLLFSIGVRILLSENKEWYNLAEQFLIEFVKNIPVLYSDSFLTYNMHFLIHLSDDAKLYGSLDKISAFPFENYMQKLKKMLRSRSNHLSQVVRRVHEQQSNVFKNVKISSKKCSAKGFEISEKYKDSCFILKNGDVVRVCDTFSDSTEITIRKFRTKNNFFITPIPSSQFSIYIVSNLSNVVQSSSILNLDLKCVLFPIEEKNCWVSIPMLQSVNNS
jgi:hypothetical protein